MSDTPVTPISERIRQALGRERAGFGAATSTLLADALAAIEERDRTIAEARAMAEMWRETAMRAMHDINEPDRDERVAQACANFPLPWEDA